MHMEYMCTGPSDVKPTDSPGPLSFLLLFAPPLITPSIIASLTICI